MKADLTDCIQTFTTLHRTLHTTCYKYQKTNIKLKYVKKESKSTTEIIRDEKQLIER